MHNQVTQRVVGTYSTPATLTAAFSGTVGATMLANKFKKLALDVTYTPAVNNSRAQILIEYSQDSIMSTSPTFVQFVVSTPSSTQVDVYGQGGDQMGTTSGTPINVPNANNSTAAQAITVHIAPDTDLVANWVRVRVKEITTGAFGTISIDQTLQV